MFTYIYFSKKFIKAISLISAITLFHPKSHSIDIIVTHHKSRYYFSDGQWLNHFIFKLSDLHIALFLASNIQNHLLSFYKQAPQRINFQMHSGCYTNTSITIPCDISMRLAQCFTYGLDFLTNSGYPDCFVFVMFVKYEMITVLEMQDLLNYLHSEKLTTTSVLSTHHLIPFSYLQLRDEKQNSIIHHMLFLHNNICISKMGSAPVFFHSIQDALNTYGRHLRIYHLF